MLWLCSPAMAAVEGRLHHKMKLVSPPLDIVVSGSGEWIFSLTEKGTVEVYGSDGTLADTLNVGRSVDQIEAGPRDNLILLKSRSEQTVQILVLEFIREIDTAEAPFKGAAGAPVTIAVFSDFQ